MGPRDDDPWKRLREREDERDQEELLRKKDTSPSRPGATPKPGSLSFGEASTEKLLELIQRAEPLIEQVNNLYNMYKTGAERRPPVERRQQLDQVMTTVMAMAKPTPALQFRCSSLLSSYSTHKERWDKLLRDIEAGKIRRG